MNELTTEQALKPMTAEGMAKVFEVERILRTLPQENCPIKHVIHAGIYSRTILLKAGVAIAGVRIKVPSQMVVSGHCVISHGDHSVTCNGFDVLTAPAGRKTAVLAIADTYITMMYPTQAQTLEEAERQATDDYDDLASHDPNYPNIVVITGELPCHTEPQQQ